MPCPRSGVSISLSKSLRSLFTIVLSLLLLAQLVLAQQTLGSMNGTVSDSSGAVIQGASVKARALATNLEVVAQSKSDGSFSIADLPIGTYEVRFVKEGFDTAIYPQFLSALLGMKFKLVLGYKGSHDIQLAMERNEVQGICVAYDSIERGTLARSGQINVLLQASLEPDPRLKAVPSGLEFASRPDERAALQLFFMRASLGRPFAAPPGVPADRVAMLRQAFDATLLDPAFLDDANKQQLRVVPITGQQMTDLIADAYKTPPAIVQRTIQAMGRGQ